MGDLMQTKNSREKDFDETMFALVDELNELTAADYATEDDISLYDRKIQELISLMSGVIALEKIKRLKFLNPYIKHGNASDVMELFVITKDDLTNISHLATLPLLK